MLCRIPLSKGQIFVDDLSLLSYGSGDVLTTTISTKATKAAAAAAECTESTETGTSRFLVYSLGSYFIRFGKAYRGIYDLKVGRFIYS